MNRPIIIFSYNRPRYLQQTLLSLRPQVPEETKVFLFQDGARNYGSYEHDKAEREQVKANIDMFQQVFPLGTVLESDRNLGVAFNQKRARDFIFEDNESAIFIEDDVVLNDYYIKMLNERMDFFSKDKEVSMVSCFGEPHRDKKIHDFLDYLTQNDDRKIAQQENRDQYMQMEHVWAYGFFRHAYREVEEIMGGYYDLIPKEYRLRPHDEIYRYMRGVGAGNKIVSSQDSCLCASLTLKGFVKISTFTSNMLYIGEWGEHSRPENFLPSWGSQEVYNSYQKDFVWSDEIKSKINERLKDKYLR
jgi:hypothetical protein